MRSFQSSMPVCKRTKNRTDQHKLVQEKKKPPPAGDWSSLQFCSLHIKLNIAPRDWTWVCSAGVLQRRFCSRAEVMGANRTFIIILMPGGPVKWLNSHLIADRSVPCLALLLPASRSRRSNPSIPLPRTSEQVLPHEQAMAGHSRGVPDVWLWPVG